MSACAWCLNYNDDHAESCAVRVIPQLESERNALKAEVDELKKSQAFWEEARFTADGEIRRWKEVAGRYREALEKIVARKLEDLPNDKKKDEFHETLMAVAAWTYCGFVAHSALLEKS